MERSYAFSDRLGPLAHEQLQGALDRFDLGELVEAAALAGGLFGQNILLKTRDTEWVFRGAPHWPWQFAKERFFAELWHERAGAPVPIPYRVEESTDLFGWGFALMPRLPGAPWRQAREGLDTEAYHGLAAAIGTGLAEMHAARVPFAGEYDPETGDIAAESSFADWAERGLRSWQARAAEVPGALEAWDLDLIDSVLASGREALAEPFGPCCVHYDFAGDNVLVEPAPNGWRLSGVVDLMTCAAGDGEQDLSRMAASLALPDRSIAAAFVAAYRARRPLRPGACERFRIYMLMDRLGLWEYGRRNNLWFPEEARFRRFARPFLELADLVA